MSNIKTILNFLSKEQCKNIIEFSNKNLELEKGKIFNDNEIQYNDVRKSSVGYSNYKDNYPNLVSDILNLINKEIKIKDCIAIESEIDLNFQFTKYEKGDYYTWHMDLGNNPNSIGRKISLVVQLSDAGKYEGGDLQIGLVDEEAYTAYKDKGSVMIFSSTMRHRVSPVTRGVRYSLVAWVCGVPFV